MEETNSRLLIAEASTNKEFDDDFKLTALFTAGTAVLAVGLKRATVVFILKQWELWIFLLLNILLLAILFCSTRTHHHHHHGGKSTNKAAAAVTGTKRRSARTTSRRNLKAAKEEEVIVSNDDHYYSYYKLKESEPTSDFCDNREAPVDVKTADDVSKLSDEELNERVESFIATFKKQLVLDARKLREP